MSKKKILILILVISAVLRFYGLSRGDTVNDEVFMSFRGIGMMDFDEAAKQTTPWEWADPDIPWWMRLSFHDHPLLVPYVEHLSMRILGENNFAFRLPSALLGVVSVYLVYLIGFTLYSENTALIAAALLGATLNSVYISRTGMQESYVIFFLLLASYLFLRALKEPKYLFWTGAAAGLAVESKYNSLILIPIFFTYLIFFRRDLFKNNYFWRGIAAFLVIISPTIVYNLMLYKNFGHFDFQFSYIFGQHPEAWKVTPGKEIGGIGERIMNFAPRLIASNSWLFLSLLILAIGGFIISLLHHFKETLSGHKFLLLVISYLLLLLLLIGPSYRFLAMLAPFFALSAAANLEYFHSNILKNVRMKKTAVVIFGLILIFEIFYSYNNQIAYYRFGAQPWLSSKIRYENYNWGYNELGDYLEKELAGKMSGITFDLKYQFLEKLREKAIVNGQALSLEPYPALIVYEGNFDGGAKLWILDRLHIYHGWPIISLNTYYDYLKQNGFDYYERSGFKYRYFILQTNIAPSPEISALAKGETVIIHNKRGDEAFKIFKL